MVTIAGPCIGGEEWEKFVSSPPPFDSIEATVRRSIAQIERRPDARSAESLRSADVLEWMLSLIGLLRTRIAHRLIKNEVGGLPLNSLRSLVESPPANPQGDRALTDAIRLLPTLIVDTAVRTYLLTLFPHDQLPARQIQREVAFAMQRLCP